MDTFNFLYVFYSFVSTNYLIRIAQKHLKSTQSNSFNGNNEGVMLMHISVCTRHLNASCLQKQ